MAEINARQRETSKELNTNRVSKQMLLTLRKIQILCIVLAYLGNVDSAHDKPTTSTPQHTAPPFQYPSQQRAMAKLSALAQANSVHAYKEILALFSSARFRAVVNKSCPSIVEWQSERILDRLNDEFAVMELIHRCRAKLALT